MQMYHKYIFGVSFMIDYFNFHIDAKRELWNDQSVFLV